MLLRSGHDSTSLKAGKADAERMGASNTCGDARGVKESRDAEEEEEEVSSQSGTDDSDSDSGNGSGSGSESDSGSGSDGETEGSLILSLTDLGHWVCGFESAPRLDFEFKGRYWNLIHPLRIRGSASLAALYKDSYLSLISFRTLSRDVRLLEAHGLVEARDALPCELAEAAEPDSPGAMRATITEVGRALLHRRRPAFSECRFPPTGLTRLDSHILDALYLRLPKEAATRAADLSHDSMVREAVGGGVRLSDVVSSLWRLAEGRLVEPVSVPAAPAPAPADATDAGAHAASLRGLPGHLLKYCLLPYLPCREAWLLADALCLFPENRHTEWHWDLLSADMHRDLSALLSSSPALLQWTLRLITLGGGHITGSLLVRRLLPAPAFVPRDINIVVPSGAMQLLLLESDAGHGSAQWEKVQLHPSFQGGSGAGSSTLWKLRAAAWALPLEIAVREAPVARTEDIPGWCARLSDIDVCGLTWRPHSGPAVGALECALAVALGGAGRMRVSPDRDASTFESEVLAGRLVKYLVHRGLPLVCAASGERVRLSEREARIVR